ncbi:MAG: adenosylcobinamide-GDP ribazoletransferase [Nitriliruptoraceae bacterium]
MSTLTSPPARPRWRRGPHLLAVAVRFLTRLPVPDVDERPGDLSRARAAFPVVGAIVAAVEIAVAALAWWLLPPLPAAVLVVLVGVACTGAFHEDGLADSFDGLWGGWTRERRVEIMRDSRIGTYGTVALVGCLMLRVSLLAGLTLPDLVRVVVAGHVLARVAVVAVSATSRPAVPEGSGGAVTGPLGGFAIAFVSVVATGTLAGTFGGGAWAPLVAGTLAALAMRGIAHRRIGGVVGDILGAVAMCTLVAVQAAGVAVLR